MQHYKVPEVGQVVIQQSLGIAPVGLLEEPNFEGVGQDAWFVGKEKSSVIKMVNLVSNVELERGIVTMKRVPQRERGRVKVKVIVNRREYGGIHQKELLQH